MNHQIEKILQYNKVFVENELYLKYTTSKYPDKKIAILSCMDTRMTELLPAALGIKNGDVKIIKNAGGQVTHEYGSAMFSLLVAVYELEVDTIVVVGHDDCGIQYLNGEKIVKKMKEKGITEEALLEVERKFKKPEQWFTGFGDVCLSVKTTVEAIKKHPLMYKEIEVFGFVMDPDTGLLREAE